jgi:hypothetical protein
VKNGSVERVRLLNFIWFLMNVLVFTLLLPAGEVLALEVLGTE